MSPEASLRAYYRALMAAWEPQDWWPARTRFEVIVGAFLTQNTAWTNVERALASLRRAHALSVEGIRRTPVRRLELLIRSAGYFRQKAKRLKNFVRHLDTRYAGSLARMFARPTVELRPELLALDGVGRETADSILLYAGGHASFVVDAYTRRILERHGIIEAKTSYEEIRELFQSGLNGEAAPDSPALPGSARPPGRGRPGLRGQNSKRQTGNLPVRSPKYVAPHASPNARVYNEYHALLVRAAKYHCLKKQAQCSRCPLEPFLPR
ncbi:MAG: endonuclease III domain-containing protein [Acidobacteria bacterium]|nr:endonuclease III domain-containing protein [Acidobacteriota bacterium]